MRASVPTRFPRSNQESSRAQTTKPLLRDDPILTWRGRPTAQSANAVSTFSSHAGPCWLAAAWNRRLPLSDSTPTPRSNARASAASRRTDSGRPDRLAGDRVVAGRLAPRSANRPALLRISPSCASSAPWLRLGPIAYRPARRPRLRTPTDSSTSPPGAPPRRLGLVAA